jgi:molybdopterin converting factor subunit 1
LDNTEDDLFRLYLNSYVRGNVKMVITIKTFASVKDIFGHEELSLDVDDTITAGEVVDMLCEKHPGLLGIKETLITAVNEEYCAKDTVLKQNDILAVFPPVSGG